MVNQADNTDEYYMAQALALAREGRFSTSPNPRVGCVLTRGAQIVGQGFHLRAGEPHAEIHALHQAGQWAKGATAYVTLEPCSHTGRTGPCAQALIDAGVARVVTSMVDPNPLVGGKGLAKLRAAGIATTVGVLASEARQLNRGFLSRIERGRPFIRLKIAASMDGKTALHNGQSQWITSAEARRDVQLLRAESCAVVTGISTVLADNPLLNVRLFATVRQPARVILDSRLRLPLTSQVITDAGSPTLIATTITDPQRHRDYLAHKHVSVLVLPENAQQHISLPALWTVLAERGFGEVMVEAGSRLNAAILAEDVADELVYYQAPKWLGTEAQAAFGLPENPAALLQNNWQTTAVTTIGSDIKWTIQRQRAAMPVDAISQKR